MIHTHRCTQTQFLVAFASVVESWLIILYWFCSWVNALSSLGLHLPKLYHSEWCVIGWLCKFCTLKINYSKFHIWILKNNKLDQMHSWFTSLNFSQLPNRKLLCDKVKRVNIHILLRNVEVNVRRDQFNLLSVSLWMAGSNDRTGIESIRSLCFWYKSFFKALFAPATNCMKCFYKNKHWLQESFNDKRVHAPYL